MKKMEIHVNQNNIISINDIPIGDLVALDRDDYYIIGDLKVAKYQFDVIGVYVRSQTKYNLEHS